MRHDLNKQYSLAHHHKQTEELYTVSNHKKYSVKQGFAAFRSRAARRDNNKRDGAQYYQNGINDIPHRSPVRLQIKVNQVHPYHYYQPAHASLLTRRNATIRIETSVIMAKLMMLSSMMNSSDGHVSASDYSKRSKISNLRIMHN
jgi:hypothetical protein